MGSMLHGDWALRGYSYLWMLPIYGATVFFEPVHDRVRAYPWYYRGLIWLALIWVLEYVSGWFLSLLIGQAPWNYAAKTKLHINGFIRLDYAPVWFAAGLIFERIHDYLDSLRVLKVK